MKFPRRRAIKIAFLSITCILAVIATRVSAFRPSPTTVYISKPFDAKGTRLAVNIPRSWALHSEHIKLETVGRETSTPYIGLTFFPNQTVREWPKWLMWLKPKSILGGAANIGVSPNIGGVITGKEEVKPRFDGNGYSLFTAITNLASPDGRYHIRILYDNADKRAFDATHKAVSESHLIEQ